MTTQTSHLTHNQLCDLLLEDRNDAPTARMDMQREHLSDCLICASELESLRSSILNFRTATTVYMRREMTQFRQSSATLLTARRRPFWQPLTWAVAAAAALAVALPIGMQLNKPASTIDEKKPAIQVQSAESDEALLEGINQDLSVGVPAPMQPLADPTASTNDVSTTTDQMTKGKTNE